MDGSFSSKREFSLLFYTDSADIHKRFFIILKLALGLQVCHWHIYLLYLTLCTFLRRKNTVPILFPRIGMIFLQRKKSTQSKIRRLDVPVTNF
jgi:hypothetical protein